MDDHDGSRPAEHPDSIADSPYLSKRLCASGALAPLSVCGTLPSGRKAVFKRRIMRELPADDDGLIGEQFRMDRLRFLVDTAAAVIRTRALSRGDATAVVEVLRDQVMRLFPDKGGTFDLIYRARFQRLIDQRFGAE